MKKTNQKENVYDSVFDFIFSVQKEKTNKPFPKPPLSSGVYASSLIEIGTQPTIYPLESAFNTINAFVASETEIKLANNEVGVDLGSILLGKGNESIKKEVSKQRAKNNFLRVGGNLHTGIDGALVSLYSKFNGASSKTAYKAGKLYAELERKGIMDEGKFFEYKTAREKETENEQFRSRGTDLMVTELVKKYPGLNKAMLLNAINEGQNQTNYNIRMLELKQKLKLAGVKRSKDLNDLTRYIWGNGGDDLGLFQRKAGVLEPLDDKIDRIFSSVESRGEKARREELYKEFRKDKTIPADVAFDMAREQAKAEFRDPDMMAEIKKHYMDIQDPKERDRAVFMTLNKNHQYDTATRGEIMRGLRAKSLANTGQDIAKTAVMTSLVLSVEENAGRQGDYAALASARKRISDVLSYQSGEKSLGSSVARARLTYSWLKDTGKLAEVLREGNWEKFGMEDLNFTPIMEKVNVTDKTTGNVIGSYYIPAKTVMGKLIGSAYYFHPNNLIRGLFLDGSLLLKWANKGGELNKKSFAYLLYRARPGALLSGLTKPFRFLANGVGKMLNPLVEGIKKFAKTLLKNIIGATGLAGWLVNRLMDLLGDRLQIIVAQIVQVVLLGAVALLFVLLESTGMLYSDKKVEGILSSPENEEIITAVEEVYFKVEDFMFSDNQGSELDSIQ